MRLPPHVGTTSEPALLVWRLTDLASRGGPEGTDGENEPMALGVGVVADS